MLWLCREYIEPRLLQMINIQWKTNLANHLSLKNKKYYLPDMFYTVLIRQCLMSYHHSVTIPGTFYIRTCRQRVIDFATRVVRH